MAQRETSQDSSSAASHHDPLGSTIGATPDMPETKPTPRMETNRMEAFSDGVMAIAITLLIIEIAVPPAELTLGVALLQLWPSYLAYAVSFLVIGAIWINHHAMIRHIARVDSLLLLLNILLLMLVAFLPFPTAVLAAAFHRAAGESLAAAFYSGTLTVIGILVNAMWWYAARGRRLLADHLGDEEARRIGRRYMIGPLGYGLGIAAAAASPWLAIMIFVLINVFYLWPRRGEHK